MRERRATWESMSAHLLGKREWAHETAPVRALGWHFSVRTDVAPLGAFLDRVFAAMATDEEAPHHYSLLRTPRRDWARHRVYRDGRRVLDTPDPTRALSYLLWDVNQQVFRSTPDKLLVHAAGVEHGGRALLLSAPSEAGKSTLAAGLVTRGWGYLSDEAVAIDLDSLLVHAYPKALSLREGSQAVLPQLAPAGTADIEPFLQGSWQVPPDDVRTGAAVRSPIPPAWIVVPQFAPGATTSLQPLSRGEALTRLMEQGLNLHHAGRRGFERLAEVVEQCRCARLLVGDLETACDAVLELVSADG